MDGLSLIEQLKRKWRVSTDAALASKLGISLPAINAYKGRKQVTARQVAELLHRAQSSAKQAAYDGTIRPIVEFFRLQRCESVLGGKIELFSSDDGGRSEHPYRKGLKEELSKVHGVYIFYDSRGNAIYAGKARKQKLWREMTLAFNRDRGSVQKIMRVRHPENRVLYRTSDEKTRQIRHTVVPLHELAVYFSAYEVADSMIDSLEALLVRSFANDLLNQRMERFRRKK